MMEELTDTITLRSRGIKDRFPDMVDAYLEVESYPTVSSVALHEYDGAPLWMLHVFLRPRPGTAIRKFYVFSTWYKSEMEFAKEKAEECFELGRKFEPSLTEFNF